LFGVPKELCAEMYIKAFATFGAGSVGSLKVVHFLDLNDDILTLVRDAHRKWAGKTDKLNFKVAWQYDKQKAAVKDEFYTLTSDVRGSTKPSTGNQCFQCNVVMTYYFDIHVH